MRKLAALVFVSIITTTPIGAINIFEGNRELGMSGRIDVDTFDDTLIEFDILYGYFWRDLLEVGARAGISDSDSFTTWRIGAFTEYHLFNETPLVPFLGAGMDIAGSDFDIALANNSDETAIVFGVQAGAKYFLTDSVAVSSQLRLDAATDDVFASDDGAEDTNWNVEFGIRFFF